MKRSMLSAAILGILGLSSTTVVLAVDINLCAGEFPRDLTPNNALDPDVMMWGYALGGANDAGACVGDLSSPGPRIVIPVGDTALNVTLTNTLPRPTSLVIPGTVKHMLPVMSDHFAGNASFPADAAGVQRVRSFDVEAAAGGSMLYSWANLQPGSYMYHSGTHPQVQVQMGLYGAATQNFATGVAYEGKPYDQEIILFYSEIDSVIHAGVAAGNYNETDMQSTIDYDPKYHFINVTNSDPDANNQTLNTNDIQGVKLNPNGVNPPLIRFFNAALQTHVPTVFEANFDVFAEDGKLAPFSRKQYTVTLPPLKTKDTYLNIQGDANFAGWTRFRLTDSAMAVSNPAKSLGSIVFLADGNEIANGNDNGMVLDFVIEPPAGYAAPVASDNHPAATRDSMSVAEGDGIANIMAAATLNDINAAGSSITILTYPKQGELTADGAGRYNYQHGGGEEDRDSIMYSLTNAAGESSTAGILIDVIPTNDAPVANNDSVTAKVGQTVEIRALNNDEDVDSATLSIQSVGSSGLGTLTAMGQVIIFEPTTEGSEDITYTVSDSSNATATAQLHLTVTAATAGTGVYTPGTDTGGETTGPTGTAPVASAKSYSVMEGSVLDITGNSILGVKGTSIGATVSTGLLEYPEHGSLQMFEDGTFVYTHNGDDEQDDHFVFEIYNDYGTSSATATISIIPKMNPPRVNDDSANTSDGAAVLIDLLRNDKDKDSALDPNGIVLLATDLPEHGTVEIVTQGNVRYTPDAGFTGVDYFRYQLKDLHSGEISKRSAEVQVRVR